MVCFTVHWVHCCVLQCRWLQCSAHFGHREEVGETALLLCKVNNLGKLVEKQWNVKYILNLSKQFSQQKKI